MFWSMCNFSNFEKIELETTSYKVNAIFDRDYLTIDEVRAKVK